MTPNENPTNPGQTPEPYKVPVEPLEPQPKQKPTKHRESIGSVLSTIAVILIAPLVALFLTAFVFQSYQVDGPSMETTLQHNDRLLVWKVPKTWSKITGHTYVPNRGDVVIFVERELGSFGQDPGKQLIKRVIGLPGDRVVVKDGAVTVYNKQHPDGFRPDKTLPYGNVIKTTGIDTDVTIRKDQIFVMGDNRDNSLDSRTFGPVAAKDIIGKLVLRVWPLGSMKSF